MKTEKIRVDPQIGLLLGPNRSLSAPLAPSTSSIAPLDAARPLVSAKRMIHRL